MTWLYEMLENFEGSVMLQLIIKKKKKSLTPSTELSPSSDLACSQLSPVFISSQSIMKLVGWVLLYLDSREVLGKVPYGTLCAPLVAVELGEHLGKPYLLQPALYSPFLALEYGNQINQFQRNGRLTKQLLFSG